MGLDMYMYSVERPGRAFVERFKSIEEIEADPTLLMFTADDLLGDGGERYCDLLPFARVVKTETLKWDEEAFKEDHRIPPECSLTYKEKWSGNVTLTYTHGTDYGVNYVCSEEEYNNYVYTEIDICFVVRCYEIVSWGSNHDLSADVHEVYSFNSTNPPRHIQNGGMHMLTQKMVEELNEINEEFAAERFGIIDSIEDDDSGLFYYESF